jgi:hypothetical protein
MKWSDAFGIVFMFIAFTVLYALFAGVPTWLLWNWLMPDIFSLNKISFMQAFGLNALCSILFKSSPTTTKSN